MSDIFGGSVTLADVIAELTLRAENAEADAEDEECRAAGLAAAYRACAQMLLDIDPPEAA